MKRETALLEYSYAMQNHEKSKDKHGAVGIPHQGCVAHPARRSAAQKTKMPYYKLDVMVTCIFSIMKKSLSFKQVDAQDLHRSPLELSSSSLEISDAT